MQNSTFVQVCGLNLICTAAAYPLLLFRIADNDRLQCAYMYNALQNRVRKAPLSTRQNTNTNSQIKN